MEQGRRHMEAEGTWEICTLLSFAMKVKLP